MKKILFGISLLILVVLSGCAMSESLIDENEVLIYGNLHYDWDMMTFTNTPQNDILYLTGDEYFDFILIINMSDNTLNSEELLGYQQLLLVLKSISLASGEDYQEILSGSSSDFKDLCDSYLITITLKDIVSFNKINEQIIIIRNINTYYSISKIDYINMRLNINLSEDEISSLDLFQTKYNELYNYAEFPFDFSENTLDDLLLLFKDNITYEPTSSELLELEFAFDTIIQLILD